MTVVAQRPDMRALLEELESAVDHSGWDSSPVLVAVYDTKEIEKEDPQLVAGIGATYPEKDLFAVDVSLFGKAVELTEHPVPALRMLTAFFDGPAAREEESTRQAAHGVAVGLVGVALITEAWTVDLNEHPEPVRPSQSPHRIEVRVATVACVDGSYAVLERRRGQGRCWLGSDVTPWGGGVPTALREFVRAMRTGL